MPSSPTFFNPTKTVLTVLLTAGLVFTALGWTDRALLACGLTPLPKQNEVYLEKAFDQSLRLFALLSVVKVTLAVVEGSEVGVGFGLELGDLVQSVYDHVDIAWKTVLAAGVILQCLRFFLQAASHLGPWLLAFAFGFGLVSLWLGPLFAKRNWFRNVQSDATMFFTVGAVLLYIALPLSINGARQLSGAITAPSLSKAEQGVSQFERDLKAMEMDKIGSISKKVEAFKTLITQKAKDLMTFLFTIIAVYIFDCVLFPLLLFFLLYRGSQALVRYLFHLKHVHLGSHDPV